MKLFIVAAVAICAVASVPYGGYNDPADNIDRLLDELIPQYDPAPATTFAPGTTNRAPGTTKAPGFPYVAAAKKPAGKAPVFKGPFPKETGLLRRLFTEVIHEQNRQEKDIDRLQKLLAKTRRELARLQYEFALLEQKAKSYKI